MNRTSTAERIGHDFLGEHERRWAQSAREADRLSGVSGESVSRFDVVDGGRRDPADRTPERLSAPAFDRSQTTSWSPVPAAGQAAAVEQYRRLAAALLQAQVERGIRVVMITSSVAGEGKSLTVANLAVTLSRSYRRNTLIIDADQRSPSQHEIFRVAHGRGLSDYLRDHDDRAAPTVELHPGLSLLPAGPPTNDPMGGLTSTRLKGVLADASATFDFTLIDTPPAALVPDAGILAPLVDGSVLVIGAGSTPFEVIRRTVATLGAERILGTVLNRAERTAGGRYGYGYGYGEYGDPRR
ncbi:MAG: CpsD/CapB family tyrosine-protein kinase [Acidobacteriota bacterium]